MASRSHLAIEISDKFARFSTFKEGVAINNSSCELGEFKKDAKKERLKDFVQSHEYLNNDFDEVTLSWSTGRTTLVPNNIFAESGDKELFNLCFSKNDDHGEIDYNRIAEISVVNLYQIPLWVKSYFVVKYPRVVLQHEGSHLVREILQNAFNLKIILSIKDDSFLLIIAERNELQFYNSFEFQSVEDVLYHLVFVLQQKELTNKEGNLMLIDGVGASQSIIKEFDVQSKKIKDLSELKISTPSAQIAKSQLLCV